MNFCIFFGLDPKKGSGRILGENRAQNSIHPLCSNPKSPIQTLSLSCPKNGHLGHQIKEIGKEYTSNPTPGTPAHPGQKSQAFPLESKWPKMIRVDKLCHLFYDFYQMNMVSILELNM